MSDAVQLRAIEPENRLVIASGSVLALVSWTGPDGRIMLASGGADGTIRRWDATEGGQIGEPLVVETGFAIALAIWTGPDGRIMLASGGDDGTIRRWDATTGAPVGEPMTGHTDWIRALTSWTGPDGRILLASAGDDSMIRRWDATTGKMLTTSIGGKFLRPFAVAASTYRYLVGPNRSQSIQELRTNISSGRWIQALTSWTGPDGRTMLASGLADGTLRRWDATTGAPVGKPLTGHNDGIGALTSWTGPDGRILLASGGHDGTIRRWDATTGTPVGKPLTGHNDWIGALTSWTGPDGRILLASASDDGTIRRWDATTGTPVGKPLTGHTRQVLSLVAWTSSDGYSMLASAASGDGTVRRWNASAGSPVGDPLLGYVLTAQPLTSWTGPDGRTVLATCGRDKAIRRWDADAGMPIGTRLRYSNSTLTAVTVLISWTGLDGHMMLAAGHRDGRITRWDATTGSPIGRPIGRHRRFLRRLRPRPVDTLTVSTTLNGRVMLASGGEDGTIWRWDAETGRLVGEPLTGHTGAVLALTAWTGPDGSILASGGEDGTIRQWDAETGTLVGGALTGHTGAVRALTAWTGPDGSILASGGEDGTIRQWDSETGTLVREPLTGHTGGIAALTSWTGPEGHVMLASGGRDGVIRVWDTTTGDLLSRVLVEPIRLRGLADRPAPRDLLGRTALIQALANLLLWRPTAAGGETGPSVVTFEGRWGTGKTTIMRLVEDRIGTKPESLSPGRHFSVAAARKILRRVKATDASDPVVAPDEYRGALTAWFNPWVCQSSEQVWAGLARSIAEAAKPVLYPSGAEARAQRYWLARNSPYLDRFAINRRMIFRILSPLLGFSVLIGIGTILIALARVNNNTLFHLGHQRITLSISALAIAIVLLLAGLAHTVVRYFGPASGFLPPDIVRSSVLSSSFGENAAETVGMLHDSMYVTRSGYLPTIQADTARTVKDLRNAGYGLVVFIDDLDRCTALTTAEVFEAVNLFLSGTTDLEAKFVIGLDPAAVAAHLDAVYKDLGDINLLQYGDDPSAGWAFLRKVVQLPVAAPHITETAIDQFLGAALDVPIETPDNAASQIEVKGRGRENRQTASPPQPPPLVQSGRLSNASEATPREPIRTGSLERQPEIVAMMRQRLEAQQDRSVREAKRMLNVWQLYQRVLDLIAPVRDDEEVVRSACHLFTLAEIVTRWPALQQQLNQSWGERRGLQILAAACDHNERWNDAVRAVGLDGTEYRRAVANLRDLLRAYDGTAVADLAAKVL